MIVPKKKSEIDIATVRCQKCLDYGHYNYECKNKRKIVIRDSRTKILNKNLTKPSTANELSSKLNRNNEAPPNKKAKKTSSGSSSSSSSSSSDSDSSSSDTSSSSEKSSDSGSNSSSSDSE